MKQSRYSFWFAVLAISLGMSIPMADGKPARSATKPAPLPPAATPGNGSNDEEQPPEEMPKPDPKEIEEFIRGANLETDSEVQALLRRAWEHIDAQRYREAVTVLQHVIDRPGNLLSSTDGRVFRPAQLIASEIIGALPKEGLEVYRLWADGEARGVAGDAARSVDAEALGQVVRRFFLSSQGDDAAFRLGSIALDRHDYSAARRLFSSVLNKYPDPSVDRAQVLLRLALTCARMNDMPGAQAAWSKLMQLGPDRVPSAVRSAVERELKSAASPAVADEVGWGMPFGSARRSGWVPDLPASLLSPREKLWALHWEQPLPVNAAVANPAVRTGVVYPGMQPQNRREQLIGWWEQNKAVPACQLAFAGERVYFKSNDTLICADLKTGKRVWEVKEYVAPERTPANSHIYYPYGGTGQEPNLLFLDHLGRSVSLIGDRVYHIEENNRSQTGQRIMRVMVAGQPQPTAKPLEGNGLSAHDAQTGRRIWRLGRDPDEAKPLRAVKFLGTPAPCLGRLLVPVDENGEMMLVALNPADGAIAWRTFLCTYAAVRPTGVRPVGVWVDGTEVLVASGKGAIFAIDGVDGSLLWASRYEPQQPKDSNPNVFWTRYYQASARGWQEDYIAADGNLVLVAPTDSDSVIAYDRRNGKFVFSKDVTDPRYCLGLHDGGLYVVGGQGAMRLDLAKQNWTWKCEVRSNAGRGILAGGQVYMPSDGKIVRIDAASGKLMGELVVKRPNDDPIGNLSVVGQNILAAGMDRIWALTSAKSLFDDLDRRLAAKPDAAAYLDRGRLQRDAGRTRQAAEDLRKSFQMFDVVDKRQTEARVDLLAVLLSLAREDAAQADELLKQAATLARAPTERASIAMARAEALAAQGKIVESARAWWEVATSRASELVVDPEDPLLRAAQPSIAAAALHRLYQDAPAGAKQELAALSESAVKKALTEGSLPAIAGALRAAGPLGVVRSAREVASRLRTVGGTEAAESLMRELISDPDDRSGAAALAALAELHESLGWRAQARGEWERLAARYPTVSLAAFDGAPNGAELARKRLAELKDVESPGAAKGIGDPPWRRAWSFPGEQNCVVMPTDGTASQFLSDHFMVLDPRSQLLHCLSLADGQTVWKANLPKATGLPGASGNPYLMYGGMMAQQLNHDEHIAVIRADRSLAAVSLLTGKTLWEARDLYAQNAVRTGVAFGGTRMGMATMDPDLNLSHGTVAVRSTANTVRVLDLATGATRWERSFNKTAVLSAIVRGSYVAITAGLPNTMGTAPSATVYVCHRTTGRLLGEFTVDGQNVYYARLGARTDWGYIEPALDANRQTRLLAREMPTGKIRWSVEWKGQSTPNVVDIQSDGLGGQLLLVGGYNNPLTVYDVATGRERFRVNADKPGMQVIGMGMLDPDRVAMVTRLLDYSNPQAPRDHSSVRIYALASGKLEREVPLHTGTPRHGNVVVPTQLELLGNWLPVARMEMIQTPAPKPPASQPRGGGVAVRPTNNWRIEMLPLTDQKGVAPAKLPLPGGKDTVEQLRMPMILARDHLIIMAKDGVLAFTSDRQAKAGKK